MPENRISIVIADDHRIIREGIKGLLAECEDIAVIGEACDGPEAVTLIQELKPDVVLMDISMPTLLGYEVVKEVRKSNATTRFLMITVYNTDIYFVRSYKAGAQGLIHKDPTRAELLEAIHAVYQTNALYYCNKSEQEIQDILNRYTVEANFCDPETVQLTYREKEIMKRLMNGQSYQDIADELFITYKTVERHKKNILTKYNARNTFELIVLFMNNEKMQRDLLTS